MIRVVAPSRLHFGLFNFGSDEPWLNLDGEPVVPARRFGGAGLMIAEPGVAIAIEPSAEWSAAGPLAARALEFAHCMAASLPAGALAPHRIVVERAANEHAGLGTGTQLGLAIAEALAVAAGHSEWDAVELAGRVGRGFRSGIGVHGFRRGGFLLDAGRREGIAPLLWHEPFPADWRIIVSLPQATPGLHGLNERQAFEQLMRASKRDATEPLCRLALLGMLPALRERDCRAFGEALYDFNARVGEVFAAAQGGRYAGGLAKEMVEEIRRLGLAGAGQSSWGPAVFAVAEDESRAAQVAARLRNRFGTAATIRVTAAFDGRDVISRPPA